MRSAPWFWPCLFLPRRNFINDLILRNNENDLALCKVRVFLEAGLFIKESNEDCLRLVAMIKQTVLNLLK